MKKQKNQNKSYKSISRLESIVLTNLKENDFAVFSLKDAVRVTKMKRTQIYNILFSLNKKGIVLRAKKDCYIIKDEIHGREFEISTRIFVPSYISFWSALSFYGFTEQQPNVIQLASTYQFAPIDLKLLRIRVIRVISKRFFGYKRLGSFNIAEKEKALVDSLSHLSAIGGIKEFSKCLSNSWNEIDHNMFVDYLLRFENKSIISRAGFLIEKLGLEIRESLIKKMSLKISKGFVPLDPLKKNVMGYNKKWKIIENVIL